MGSHIPENRRAYDAIYRAEHREERAAAAKAWRVAHPDKPLAYSRSRLEQRREESRRYRQTEHGRAVIASTRDMAKHAAHEAVRRAVLSGRLVKQPCQVCGNPKVQGHHHRGYAGDARLDVIWLCHQHHEDAHHAA